MRKFLDRLAVFQRVPELPSTVEREKPALADEERRALEERARELDSSNAFFRAALDSIADGMLALQYSTKAKYYNAKYMQMWAIPPEMLDKGRDAELLALHAAQVRDPEQFIARIKTLKMRPDEEAFDEIELKDGRTFERYVVPQRLNGQTVGVVLNFRDVTERKKTMEEIRRARELAEEATKMKSDFLANMSHEIRTPMNAIIGMSHLALKTEMTARQRDYIGKVQSSGQHLMGIINDILDFSKIEAGKLDIEHVDFELEKLLDNVGNLLSQASHAKGLELVFDIAPDVPQHLIGDALRLGQILINFASNAVKFTEQGEIVISARVKERTARDLLLHFAVRDTGMGLSQEQMGRLFQSFQQADSSTTRKFGGTGLGLAISRSLVELMGGQVGVDSEVGQGSTFWFTVRVGVSEFEKRKLMPTPDLRGCRALVVDDNEYARMVIVEMLQSMTFNVTAVGSGKEAVAEVRRAAMQGCAYEVIYLDWRMPGMDGMETARQIKALGLESAPRFLMVTAHGREEMRKEGETLGIVDVLVKPVAPSMLFDMTMSVLGGKRDERRDPREVPPAVAGLEAVNHARLLLVEDNEINQQVASEILRDAGFVVDVADNGQIALEQLHKNRYDLVLMDMQMPVMDGIEATLEIRKLARFDNLPVIAMTANAMQQARERCIQAGMNDFLSKPINPKELWDMLLKWIKPRGVAAATPLPDQAAMAKTPAADVPHGIEGLDTATGLSRMLNKKLLYIAMLRRFVAGQKGVPQEIRTALDQQDWATAERLAHTTKGVAGTIGATQIPVYAAALESAIKERMSLPEIEQRLSALQAPLTEFIAAVELQLPPESAVAPARTA